MTHRVNHELTTCCYRRQTIALKPTVVLAKDRRCLNLVRCNHLHTFALINTMLHCNSCIRSRLTLEMHTGLAKIRRECKHRAPNLGEREFADPPEAFYFVLICFNFFGLCRNWLAYAFGVNLLEFGSWMKYSYPCFSANLIASSFVLNPRCVACMASAEDCQPMRGFSHL